MKIFLKSAGRILWFFIKLLFWYGVLFLLSILDSSQAQCISAPCPNASIFNGKLYHAVHEPKVWILFLPLFVFLLVQIFISKRNRILSRPTEHTKN